MNNLKKNNLYCIILAGGDGQRLWPFSRNHLPKQLLCINNEQSMLDQAIDRIQHLVRKEHIWICTTQQHQQKIREAVGNRVGRIVIEPSPRNTGPAILYCNLLLSMLDPNAVAIFLPADSFIPSRDIHRFAAFVEYAADSAKYSEDIVLLGIKPKYIAPGYGYIHYELTRQMPYKVIKFIEKPSVEYIQQLTGNNILWNSGVFCAKVSVFIQEFNAHAPSLCKSVLAFIQGLALYTDIAMQSFDKAILEKSTKSAIIPIDITWYDIGNIATFLSLKKEYNKGQENLIAIEANNNLVDVPRKRVALIGVNDLCVIEMDDILLIVPQSKAEMVKTMVKHFDQEKATEYL